MNSIRASWVCIHHEHNAHKPGAASSVHAPEANLLKAQGTEVLQSFIVHGANCIVNLPQTLLEALTYTLCAYFLAGQSMAGKGSSFFAYLALLFLVAYFGSPVFFFLSTISSIPEVGNALAGLLVSIFLLFSGFVIYPSNMPTYWKWLMYVNPIHWANVSFCRFQFSEGYSDPSSNYLGQLPFFDQFPTKTVGKAYVAFYELSDDSKRPWLPYVILLGWIAFANILTLFGLKNIEFVERSQSLPFVRKSTTAYNYEEDAGGEFQSNYSFSENSEKYDTSTYPSPRSSGTIYRKMKNNGKVDAWMEEFRVDIERNGLGIPVKPLTLLFEGLSFTR